jgi:hypothetical protein
VGLSGRLGRRDADLARLAGVIDAEPGNDSAALRVEGSAAVDEIEAVWKAPPQPPGAGSSQVH